MNFALWIQTITTIVIAFFAYKMWKNAEANLKNAAAMRKLEEANYRITLWPEIKALNMTIDKYTLNAGTGNLNDPKSHQYIDDYLSAVYFAPYFFQEGDELRNQISQLRDYGLTLRVKYLELPLEKGSDEGKKWASEIGEMTHLLYAKANEIKELLQKRFNMSITSQGT